MFEYSVVIPAYNAANFIGDAIESVLSQTLPPREVIVVDDGSNDGTGSLAKTFPLVKVIRHDHCCGPSQARNTGISAASCEWIAFLDADDRWDRQKIELQSSIAKSTGAGLVYCGIRVLNDESSKVVEIPASTFRSHRRLCKELLIWNCITGSTSAVLVRKNLIEKLGGFDIHLPVAEDWDMWIRLSQLTKFAAVNQPLVSLYKRRGSWGGDPCRMFEQEQKVIEKNALLFSSFRFGYLLKRKAKARLYKRRGIAYLMLRQLSISRKDLAKSVFLWPFCLDSLIPLFKICVGMISVCKDEASIS